MPRSKLLPSSSDAPLADPFTKKGALTLFWLLARRAKPKPGAHDEFSVNQAARELELRPHTVHRVVRSLEYDGIIRSEGTGTKKRFYLADPQALLIRWLKNYQIQRKCRLRRYAISDPKAFPSQRDHFLQAAGAPALHTAARLIFHAGVTNLSTTEAYLLDSARVESLTKKYGLVAQERGYEVLLIEPYYRGVVERFKKDPEDPTWTAAMAILTFLDLYHFPLRGIEQAEAIYRKTPVLKTIASWSALESIEPA
jgi:DNA-binding MarR family transcriptional regulator